MGRDSDGGNPVQVWMNYEPTRYKKGMECFSDKEGKRSWARSLKSPPLRIIESCYRPSSIRYVNLAAAHHRSMTFRSFRYCPLTEDKNDIYASHSCFGSSGWQ